jgi:carbamoyl-phosphate synthase large subunit
LVDNFPARPGADHAPRTRPSLRILVSCAGRQVGLVRAFRSSAAALGVDLKVVATDLYPEWSSACFEADVALAAPPAASSEYIESLLGICTDQDIDIVVPTIDTELLALSLARDKFAAIGATAVIGGPDLVRMANDKLLTARVLAAANLPAPRTSSTEDMRDGDGSWGWPLLATPRFGGSTRGAQIVHELAEVRSLGRQQPFVVRELLKGKEYTVSLFFDGMHRLRCVVPHRRVEVREGEVEKGVTVREPVLVELARGLATKLDRPFGPLCFQAILADNGQARILGINARFGAGYPLAHRAGATFARWLMEERLGLPCSANNRWRADVVMLRFDDAVFP